MADISNMSMKELRAHQEKVSSCMDSIISTVGSNNFALVQLFGSPDFAEACRKKFNLSSAMSDDGVQEFIRNQLFSDEAKPKRNPQDCMSVIKTGYTARCSSPGYTEGSNRGYYSPPVHRLEVVDGQLTSRGFAENDKDFASYYWLTPLEYIQYWDRTIDDHRARKENYFYGVYGIRVKGKDGVVSDFVYSTFNGSGTRLLGCTQELAKAMRDVPVTAIYTLHFFKKLMEVLYEQYGDRFTQLLAEMMFDSWQDAPGCDEYLKKFLLPEEVYKDCRANTKNIHYHKLPGQFTIEDVTDSIVIDREGLIRAKREKEDGYSSVYFEFNNERYYTQLFLRLAKLLSDEPEDIVYKRLGERIQFLVRPKSPN